MKRPLTLAASITSIILNILVVFAALYSIVIIFLIGMLRKEPLTVTSSAGGYYLGKLSQAIGGYGILIALLIIVMFALFITMAIKVGKISFYSIDKYQLKTSFSLTFFSLNIAMFVLSIIVTVALLKSPQLSNAFWYVALSIIVCALIIFICISIIIDIVKNKKAIHKVAKTALKKSNYYTQLSNHSGQIKQSNAICYAPKKPLIKFSKINLNINKKDIYDNEDKLLAAALEENKKAEAYAEVFKNIDETTIDSLNIADATNGENANSTEVSKTKSEQLNDIAQIKNTLKSIVENKKH